MNICYITHEYGQRWVKYAQHLRDLGHQVDLIELQSKSMPSQVDVDRYSPKYDIVWVFSADSIWHKVLTDEFLEAVKGGKSVLIGDGTLSTTVPFVDWVNNYKAFDLFFAHSQMVTDMSHARGATNVVYMPYGFDIDYYYPLQTRKKYNISFVGSAQTNLPVDEDKRVETIDALRQFKVCVFGKSFKKRLGRGIKVRDFNGHKDMNKIFNQSRINLNISFINSQLPEFINEHHPKCRFYEIPGSGNFMVSGWAPEFEAQFHDKVHCVYYDTLHSLCERVEYYLSHEKEREEIARAAYHHAVDCHQTKFRFKKMVDIIEARFLT